MFNSRTLILLAFFATIGLWMVREYDIAGGGNSGPDVIVGDIPAVQKWGSDSDESAFTIGTTSCNIGTQELAWVSNTNQHPVITQNLYRIKDGRIEMLGMAWLKHGFFALQMSLCGNCQPSGTGSALGIGCSDPYSTGNNASQGSLGPRSQVNAATGFFPYPHGSLPQTGPLDGRLRVFTNDINASLNSGARYFFEAQYIQPQDATFENDNNNASYREAFAQPSGNGWTMQLSGSAQTVRQKPAISAWQAVHNDVQLFEIDVPTDGRVIVGMRTTPINGGGFHTEIAIENLNSHQSIRALKMRFPSDTISNPGFNDVDYQFEAYSGTDWAPSIDGNEIEWATETFSENANANALRWSTLYSYWCDSEFPPSQITLGMFRPGEVDSIDVLPTVPSSIVDAKVYHSSFAGAGTPPWNRIDTSKTVVKEGNGPSPMNLGNLINSAQGINGLVFDIQDLPASDDLDADDFEFQMSPVGAFDANSNPPTAWQAAPAPSSISVTPGSPSRVLIEWPNQSIMNRWVRVTIRATEETGLEQPETYYAGHLLGKTTGPSEGFFNVSFADIDPIRQAVGQNVDASSSADIDKDGSVAFTDISAMRVNVGAQLTQITVP